MVGLTAGNWIAIVGLIIAALGASFTGANYLAGSRERRRNARNNTPRIKATINKKLYENGWRSVQLHVVPVEQDNQTFSYANWRIERACLLRPKSAVLARAEEDDYASGVFYPERPVRRLEGKSEGRPQRFALEFFIKFPGDDSGQKATFKVTFSHTIIRKRLKALVSAYVPSDP